MSSNVFLRYWEPGDVVTADDMQALVDAVAMLEADADVRGAAAAGACRRVDDGPQGWPWQVVAVPGDDGYEVRVVPGVVLAGLCYERVAGEEGEDGDVVPRFNYLTLEGAGAALVEDFDKEKDVNMVWLELTGVLSRCYVTHGELREAGVLRGDLLPGEAAKESRHERVELIGARLRVTCEPLADALRVWPLAVVTKGHRQPVTQLVWGDLSAVECRGIALSDGGVLWPSDRAEVAAWGTQEHAAGMDAVAEVMFSSGEVSLSGELMGCMDEDGALEFYLGEYKEPGGDEPVGPGEDEPGEGEDEFGEDEPGEDEPPPGPYEPVGPGPGEDEPGEDVRVKYGYVAGDGFSACKLVKAGDGELYWELELDSGFLAQACAGMEVPVTVRYEAGGAQAGTYANVEMGLGVCAASASGMVLSGTAGLVFRGNNGVDASKKSDTVTAKYTANPDWVQGGKWYLSPKKVHKAGAYVQLERASNGWEPVGFVKATAWYRFSVKKDVFRRNALACLKREMAGIVLADAVGSVSVDSKVSGELSGNLTAPVLRMTLGDAEE